MALRTETESYWRDEFTVTPEIELKLQDHFLEANQPLTLTGITRTLMSWEHIQELPEESSGVYSPVQSYQAGTTLTFPLSGNQVGEVLSTRAGRNPRYGDFSVMTVRFRDEQVREFASELSTENASQFDMVDAPPISLDELHARFGALAQEEVEAALEASSNFVQVAEEWLPRFMLVGFHEGHINIADAMIDIMGAPLSTEELLKEIPLEEEATPSIKRFSLAHTLEQSENFVNLGSAEQPQWYLTRLARAGATNEI